MKVLLLNPPFKTSYGRYSRTSRSPAITKSGTLYYPIWLAFVAGVLEEGGHEVRLIDACADGLGRDSVFNLSRDFNPRLIVLDTSTPSIINDVEIAGVLKDLCPAAFVVLMGTHPTALPEDTLNIDFRIDAIARGEAEYTILDLATRLETLHDDIHNMLPEVAGISYRVSGEIFHNPDRPKNTDLDSLPFLSKVYKKHLNCNNYFFSAAAHPMIMLMTGRGCPAQCHYCVYPQTMHSHRYVCRSIENIIQEFVYISKELPEIRSIGIEDDTFTISRERVQSFCNMLIKSGLNSRFSWWVNSRVNTLDLETMTLMKIAGCRLLIPGFESSSQEILNNIKKGTKVEDAYKFMENARAAGLLVHGCFMVGNPGETKSTMEETLRMALKLNPDTAQFFPMIPYPGTRAFDWASKNGYLTYTKFSDWLTEDGLHNTILNPGELTASDLVDFCDYARKRYYLRPRYILRKGVQSLISLKEFKRNFMGFRQLIVHLLGGHK